MFRKNIQPFPVVLLAVFSTCIHLLITPYAFGEGNVSEFLDRYDKAATTIEDRYKFSVVSVRGRIYDGQGKLLVKAETEYKRKDDLYLLSARVMATYSTHDQSNFRAASGGSPEKMFDVSEAPGKSRYSIQFFGPRNVARFGEERAVTYRPFFVSTYFDQLRIAEWLKRPNMKVLSARHVYIDKH